MKPSERLLARLRAIGLDIPEDATIVRTYVGANQRAEGSWSWYVVRADGSPEDIGSQYPVTTLLRGRMVATRGDRSHDIDIHPAGPNEHASAHWTLCLIEDPR